MTLRELDPDQLLGALGALHHAERAELARLERPATELAALEPERAQALENRLMDELLGAKGARSPVAEVVQPPSSFKDLRLAVPSRAKPRAARLIAAAAASVAMAAAVMLWARQPDAQPFELTYTLVAPAPDAPSRSAAQQVTSGVYSFGRTLRFALRPAERYEGALRVTCYAASQEEGAVVQLEPQVELDPAGGASVTLPAAMLSENLRAGSWQLRFYIAPPSAAAVDESQVRAQGCPKDTRCLSFAARFVQPRAL